MYLGIETISVKILRSNMSTQDDDVHSIKLVAFSTIFGNIRCYLPLDTLNYAERTSCIFAFLLQNYFYS